MNNKKYKTTMATIAGLMVISGGMFAYENVYVAKKAEANKVTIYVAKQDIQAHTAIKSSMFLPIEIDNTSVLRGYVLDLKELTDKELKGGILKGEPLTQQRLTDKGTGKIGSLLLNITPDSVGSLKPNDNVKVYVQLVNKDTGEITVKELFANKKVIGEDSSEAQVLAGETEGKTVFNVVATEKEVQDYFVAKESGSIIAVKINELDTNKISATGVDKFVANSEEVKNSKPSDTSKDEKDGQAIQTYTVKSGDTLEDLSLKFKTKKETISALNDGRQEFKAGEMIQVPAN